MDATVTQLSAFVVAVIATTPTIETVTLLLKMLRPFYNRSGDHERSRAVDLTVVVLRTYYEHASDIKLGTASEFGPLSCILGRLTPRLVDSLSSVRVQSLHALHQALRLAHANKGHGLETGSSVVDVSSFVDDVRLAEEGKMDGQMAKMAVKRFGEIIESRLPQSQIQTYLSAIFEMLSDRQSQVSSAAAQLLTQILSTRGASLHAEAETLVTTLLSKLPEVHSCVQTYSDLLSALVAFSLHQQVIVTDVLLKQPLPYSTEVSNAWECLCRDRSLFPSLVEYTLELTASALEDPHTVIDTGGGAASKLVRQEVCAYVAALHEIVKGGDMECILSSPSSSPSSPSSSNHHPPSSSASPSPHDRLASVMVVLLQLLFSMADCQFPIVAVEGIVNVVTPEVRRLCERPSGLVTNALRTLLTRTRVDGVLEEMNTARAWTECTDREMHVNAVTRLMRSLCEHRPQWVEAVVRGVQMKEQSEREPLRAASVAVVAAIIDRCPGRDGSFNGELFDHCVSSLHRALNDQSLRIRKLSIRGMGELADRATRYASVCVDAAMSGLDDVGDRKDEVATESIVALNKLIGNASDTQLRAILPQVLLKVRPCFDKESPFLRAAAFRLFGEMAARVGHVEQGDFLQHLHANIVIILLHMNEEDEEVRKACTSCMSKCALIFGNELVDGVAKVHISADSFSCSSYGLFLRETAMALTSCFPDRVNGYALTTSNYFKSSQSRIRAGAAQLTGHLLDSLTPQIRSTISRDIIFGGLVLLLKDVEDVSVRVATARAIASLHSYV
uniref:Hpo-27 n=1 Tax=Pristionchus pacificus TaxID=54126 RepID=A0A2A6BML1_PRIPA|eukprot:PDM67135.1 hpo-27 [Pristionchus pacificus]